MIAHKPYASRDITDITVILTVYCIFRYLTTVPIADFSLVPAILTAAKSPHGK